MLVLVLTYMYIRTHTGSTSTKFEQNMKLTFKVKCQGFNANYRSGMGS